MNNLENRTVVVVDLEEKLNTVLNSVEKEMVLQYYIGQLTHTDIAADFYCSEERVNEIIEKALNKLRA